MYNPSLNWMEQVKFIAREMIQDKQFVLEGIVTSVDPNPPYKVRVNLEPYGVETGWLKIATPYAGNGFGFIFPPPDEGTAVKVIFDMGDIKNGTVISNLFNDEVKMPSVPAGTFGLVHKTGSTITVDPQGNITISSVGTVSIKGTQINLN